MNGIGAKPRLIPEEDLATFRLGLLCNGWIGLAPPPLDRLRIALICPLQRLLWCQVELGEQFTNRRKAQCDAELSRDQVRHH